MVMYNESPGVLIDLIEPREQTCIISHCNFDRNSGKGIVIQCPYRDDKKELDFSV